MNAPPRPLRADLVAALDTVEVVAGFAWRTAEIELADDGRRWRVGKISTRREPGDSDRGLAALGLDTGAWIGACQAAFGRVREALDAEGVSFTEGTLRCRRTDLESAHVDFVSPDGTSRLAVEIPTSTARGQLLNDALCGMLVGGLPDWTARQQRVERDLEGLIGWDYRGATASLHFRFDGDDSVDLPVQVLGSYARAEYSWCWSWANATYEPPDFHRVARLRDQLTQSIGAGALWRPGFYCDERFAVLVAQLAAEQLGALGVFSADAADGLRICYALFNPS